MGIGFTLDSALRVAKLGISTVMSLADDRLIERLRRHYGQVLGIPQEPIPAKHPDARAARITAWLDLVDAVVTRQMKEMRALPLELGNDKWRYFTLLPQSSPLRARFEHLRQLRAGPLRDLEERELSAAMRPGAIDCNIMTKIDMIPYDEAGHPRDPRDSLAKAALRGFARSRLQGSMVLSAGVNPSLFGYMEELPGFQRDEDGCVKKPVILKVSDYRSALIQGKFLARKGIEVAEFRIESGLNCGGHVFPTDGELMGPILREFAQRRDGFPAIFEPLLERYFSAQGKRLHPSAQGRRILVTAQGGVGTHAEMLRLLEDYGLDAVGWGSPFLLVPEVVLMDEETRTLLAEADEEDLYTSDASPLGVRFNNLHGSSSERWMRARIDQGTPGSPCPNRLLAMNSEFGPKPLCTASSEYLQAKLAALGYAVPPSWEKADATVRALYEKACICAHLGNSAVSALGTADRELPVAVCPGPNLAYFGRTYTLEEMIDHIYGRGPSLVPAERPHFFAKEVGLYVEHLERMAAAASEEKAWKAVERFRANLLQGLLQYRAFGQPYDDENLASLRSAVEDASARLSALAPPASQREPEAKDLR